MIYRIFPTGHARERAILRNIEIPEFLNTSTAVELPMKNGRKAFMVKTKVWGIEMSAKLVVVLQHVFRPVEYFKAILITIGWDAKELRQHYKAGRLNIPGNILQTTDYEDLHIGKIVE